MAKKIVRGITGIKEINKQDFDTNNVNDLLSDGQYSYIHRKKGKSEEYHNLTDNIKTISSDNTDLLRVTNFNKTNNTAILHPKHDAQKEQVLESERNTVSILHGTNATTEKTKVDTNPQKVLEHDNLRAGDGLDVVHDNNISSIVISPTKKQSGTNANELLNGIAYGKNIHNAFIGDFYNSANYITLKYDDSDYVQFYTRESGVTDGLIVMAYRFIKSGSATAWREMTIDTEKITTLLNQKQNSVVGNGSIGVLNNSLQQLYCFKEKYDSDSGVLKTHVKSISNNTSVFNIEEEFNFILKINQGQQTATFTLNEHDRTKFSNIMAAYGTGNSVRINGCLFELSDSTLTVTTDANTSNNQVITFSDII